MATSFYFYDLETSGVNPRESRIMQFGGQRTDMELNPVGEPHNILIRLTPDTLPEPDAVLITGITPQMTVADGITEAEFLKIFYEEIAVPGTIFAGFNSIRFDDEFMRFLHYRNFYDAYEWQWQEERSRWDILDVVRMTRALRPGGIKWPVDSEGKASNRLELLTSINKLEHANAHDALADVQATIALARMIYNKQTKLFNYLLGMRDKRKAAELVETDQPFVYTSGKYPSEYEKTTVAVRLAGKRGQDAIVWDLRQSPEPYGGMSPRQLADKWKWQPRKEGEEPKPRLPAKTLRYNRCPAIAPLSVLDTVSQQRLQLDMADVKTNFKLLQTLPDFGEKLVKAAELLNKERQTAFIANDQEVDAQLYDGFFADSDRTVMSALRAAEPDQLQELAGNLKDERLKALLPLYKARNFPKSLDDDERQSWEKFIANRLTSGQTPRLQRYFTRLEELASRPGLTKHQQYLLEELQLYGQSLVPELA